MRDTTSPARVAALRRDRSALISLALVVLFVGPIAFFALTYALRLSVHGPVREWRRPDGSLTYRTETREDWPFHGDSWDDGKFETWWENGQLHETGALLYGKRDGPWRIYDEDGTLAIAAEFHRGALVGDIRARQRDTGDMVAAHVHPDIWFDTEPVTVGASD